MSVVRQKRPRPYALTPRPGYVLSPGEPSTFLETEAVCRLAGWSIQRTMRHLVDKFGTEPGAVPTAKTVKRRREQFLKGPTEEDWARHAAALDAIRRYYRERPRPEAPEGFYC